MEKPEDLRLPIISLSKDIPDNELVQQIASACSEFGSFQVVSHGIAPELIQAFNVQCKRYFNLPHETKLQWKRNEGNARGFFDDELTKQRRDWKEALDFGVPRSRDWTTPDRSSENLCLDGWNQLPSEDVMPNFRPTVIRYFEACAELSDRLAVLMAKGMNRDENEPIVQKLREKHSSYLRVNYYPPCQNEDNEDTEDESKPLGISPHRDAGFLTVLLQDDDCHSLQVWKDDRWILVHPIPGALTINTGDMAQIWSNGRYVAPLHRVLTNPKKVRYSAPFFYNPSYDTWVKPLVEDDKPAVYHPVLWGYFRAVRFAGDLTDLGVEIQIDHFLKAKPSGHLETQTRFAREADFDAPFSVKKYRAMLTNIEEHVENSQ